MSKRLKAFLVVAFVLFSGWVFAQASNLLEIEPRDDYEVKDGKIYFRQGEAGLILEPATPEVIAKYYSDRGAAIGNPFGTMGGDMQTATIFLFTILNRSNGNATFTPRYVTLKIKTEAYFPMDFTLLLDFTESLDKAVRQIIEHSVFHSPETIPSGKIVTKLLIFPALPKKFDQIKLTFDYLFFEKSEIRKTFYFKRKKS